MIALLAIASCGGGGTERRCVYKQETQRNEQAAWVAKCYLEPDEVLNEGVNDETR